MSVFNEHYASTYDELYRHKDYDLECNLIVELINRQDLKVDSIVSSQKETHNMRYFFPQEIILFLEISGFEVQSMSAFPSLDASLSKHSWNALCVARVKERF